MFYEDLSKTYILRFFKNIAIQTKKSSSLFIKPYQEIHLCFISIETRVAYKFLLHLLIICLFFSPQLDANEVYLIASLNLLLKSQ